MMKHHRRAYQQLQTHQMMITFMVAGCYSTEHGREA
jgi:hypothetical protein